MTEQKTKVEKACDFISQLTEEWNIHDAPQIFRLFFDRHPWLWDKLLDDELKEQPSKIMRIL